MHKNLIIFFCITLVACQQASDVTQFIDLSIVEEVKSIEIPTHISWSCNELCASLDTATSYTTDYTSATDSFSCICYSAQENPIKTTALPNVPDPIVDMFSTKEQHWTHMPVTYSVTHNCGDYETRQIGRAIKKIEDATVVSFVKVSDLADITIRCSYIADCYQKTTNIDGNTITQRESICDHAAGYARITKTRGNQILNAEIEMIGLDGFAETRGKGMSGFFIGTCGHQNTEMHEIFHTFGLSHVLDPRSIMAAQEDSVSYTLGNSDQCVGSEKEIDLWIVEHLERVYG